MTSRFGFNQIEFNFILQVFSEVFGPDWPKRIKIWVFGSRARGDHRTYSDLDLLVESESSVSDDAMSALREKFEESDFPFKVDLVQLSELADAYRESVMKDRRPFQ
jgi:predicted nucleotidyltransferase